jgi:hypothetical protein
MPLGKGVGAPCAALLYQIRAGMLAHVCVSRYSGVDSWQQECLGKLAGAGFLEQALGLQAIANRSELQPEELP